MPGGDERSDRVAGGHHQHLDGGPRAAARQVRTGEHRHTGQPDPEAEYPPEAEALLAAGEPVENRGDDRGRGDQQAGHRARQVAFGVRQEKPGRDDLEEGEPQ